MRFAHCLNAGGIPENSGFSLSSASLKASWRQGYEAAVTHFEYPRLRG